MGPVFERFGSPGDSDANSPFSLTRIMSWRDSISNRFQSLSRCSSVFAAAESNGQEDSFRAAWQCISLGLIEYRRGDFAAAEKWSRRCLAYAESNAPRTATAQVILAMALQQLHRTAEARAELAAGQDAIDGKFRAGLDQGSAPHGFWFDWVFARILLREAQGLISPISPDAKS